MTFPADSKFKNISHQKKKSSLTFGERLILNTKTDF